AERRLTQEIWRDARATEFHGAPSFALSPEWEFLYLAVHAARHGAFQLKWLADLDQLCRPGAIDWGGGREAPRRLKWEGGSGAGWAASHELLETPVPEAFDALPAPRRAAPSPAASESSLQPEKDTIFAFRLLSSNTDRFCFACARLFIPTAADWRWLKLPEPL